MPNYDLRCSQENASWSTEDRSSPTGVVEDTVSLNTSSDQDAAVPHPLAATLLGKFRELRRTPLAWRISPLSFAIPSSLLCPVSVLLTPPYVK